MKMRHPITNKLVHVLPLDEEVRLQLRTKPHPKRDTGPKAPAAFNC